MKFEEFIANQKLTPTDEAFIEHICKRWDEFSNTVGRMNRKEVAKVINYLIQNRPNSKTLGARAVQRFNSLNKVRWEDLTNGDRENSRSVSEEQD